MDSSSKRLLPNPRRHKVPVQNRKRVVTACNSCNVRRIKCSGEYPCRRCALGSRTCIYPSAAAKITISKSTYADLEKRCELLQNCLKEAVPAEENRKALLSKWTNQSGAQTSDGHVSGGSPEVEQSQEQNGIEEGRILQDPDGYRRYMGESSGAAFMDRVREFVSTVLPLLSGNAPQSPFDPEESFTSLIGRYHTQDSRPLLLPDMDPYAIPPWEDTDRMLAVFHFFGGEGGSQSTCGGIYYWGDTGDALRQVQNGFAQISTPMDTSSRCILNGILALACQFDNSFAPAYEVNFGETFFARAKFHLLNPMEEATLPQMRALAIMGYYLLGINRRDAAYMYIGLAARIATAHGLHRGWMIGEANKREFWNIFILDRWLSCLMGRPAMIPEEAIRVDLPIDVAGSYLPPAVGLRSHVELSIVMGDIVSKVYGISSKDRSYFQISSCIEKSLQRLFAWFEDLPVVMKLSDESTVTERSILILHMIYNQLIILCTRPSLFLTVKHAIASRFLPPNPRKNPDRIPNALHTPMCANAARQNVHLTRKLYNSHQAALLVSTDYHYSFNAAIVLELIQLLPDTEIETDTAEVNFIAEYLEEAGDKGSESAKDCARIVREFAAVVSRLKAQRNKRPRVHTMEMTQHRRRNTATKGSDGLENRSEQAPLQVYSDADVQIPDVTMREGTLLDTLSPALEQWAGYEDLAYWFQDDFFRDGVI